MSLLGGGALFVRESFAQPAAVEALMVAPPPIELGVHWKIRAYNFLLQPLCYGFRNSIPLLNLGSTVFRPLRRITALDRQRQHLLSHNVQYYLKRSAEAAARIHQLLPAAMDLPARLAERSGRLLRYPVPCNDSRQRDALLGKLSRAGLGASAMYRHPLLGIEGIGKCVRVSGELHGARRFADCLLTLPVHAGVDARSLERIGKIFNSTA